MVHTGPAGRSVLLGKAVCYSRMWLWWCPTSSAQWARARVPLRFSLLPSHTRYNFHTFAEGLSSALSASQCPRPQNEQFLLCHPSLVLHWHWICQNPLAVNWTPTKPVTWYHAFSSFYLPFYLLSTFLSLICEVLLTESSTFFIYSFFFFFLISLGNPAITDSVILRINHYL